MLLCGALTLLVTVAVAAPRDALLYDYATQGGSGTVQNVEIRPWGSSQRGVFARRGIAAGEEVFRVPRGRMICEHDLKAHPMRELFDELSGMAAKGHPLAGAVAYALFLISHTRQRESPLKPLLDSFPSYLHHPLVRARSAAAAPAVIAPARRTRFGSLAPGRAAPRRGSPDRNRTRTRNHRSCGATLRSRSSGARRCIVSSATCKRSSPASTTSSRDGRI